MVTMFTLPTMLTLSAGGERPQRGQASQELGIRAAKAAAKSKLVKGAAAAAGIGTAAYAAKKIADARRKKKEAE